MSEPRCRLRNPFAMYHVDPDHKEREFLTEEELDIFAGIELVRVASRDIRADAVAFYKLLLYGET